MAQNILYFVNILCLSSLKNVYFTVWGENNHISIKSNQLKVLFILLVSYFLSNCFMYIVERKLLKFSSINWVIYFSFQCYQYLPHVHLSSKCICVFTRCTNIQNYYVLQMNYPFIVMKCPSLFLETFLVLKSNSPKINITIPALLCLVFA